MIKKTCKCLTYLALAGCFLLGSMVAGALYYLSVKPLEISEYVDFLEYDFTFAESRLYFKKLKLFYDGSLQLRGEDLVLLDKKNGIIKGQIKQADLALSNRGLATGRLLVKHATIKDVNLTVEILPNLIKIGSVPLKNIKKGQNTTDLVAFFNGAHASSRWKRLKTVEMQNVNINLIDDVRKQNWQITDATLAFTKHKYNGEKIELAGMVGNELAPTKKPIKLGVVHAPGAENVRLSWELENSSTEIIQPYLPEKLKNVLNANGKLRIILNILPENRIGNSDFSFQLGETTLMPEAWFSHPISFKNLNINGHYSTNNQGTLHLESLVAEDTDGVKLKMLGDIYGIEEEEIKLNLTASIQNAPFKNVIKYFPDKRMAKTVRWMNKNVQKGHVESLSLTYNGKPSDLPHCKKNCGFKGEIKYTDGQITFMPRVAPVALSGGQFLLQEDKLFATSSSAQLKDQQVSNLSVELDNLFSPVPSNITVKAESVEGPLKGLLGQIDSYLENTNWRPELTGQHKTQGQVFVPLGDETKFEDIKMALSSDVMNLTSTVPHQENLTFESEMARLEITEDHLTIQAKGQLAEGINAQVFWQEDMKSLGENAKVKLDGVAQGAALMNLLKEYNIGVEGQVPFNLAIQQNNKNGFSYQLQSNLTNPALNLKYINWAKPAGEEVILKTQGQLVEMSRIKMDEISLSGPKVDIKGQASLGNSMAKSSVNLGPFKAGRTNANIKWDGQNLAITGHTLDLSGWPIQFSGSGQGGFPAIKGVVQLNNLYLQKDSLHEVAGHFELKEKYLTNTEMTAKTNDRSAVILSTYEENGVRKLNLQAGNGGSFLRAIGLYSQMRDGQMVLNINFLKEGIIGIFYFQDAYFQDAPIVVKLLSLLSLEELLSGENGILFNRISMPFFIKDNMLVMEKSHFEGPSIGMKLQGEYNLKTTEVSFKGQMAPAESLNSLVSKIPLIGRLITGSQKNLLAADFTVKGNYNNPNVFVNPLSVVTPGIIKDIFGVFEDDKSAITKPTPQEEPVK